MTRYVLIFLALLGLSGCTHQPPSPQPPVPLEVLEETLQWARENIEALQQLPLGSDDAEDFQHAQRQLRLAESSFEEAYYEESYISALESLAASQELLQRFYDNAIVLSAREAKQKIEAIAAEDPESPFQEFLPVLDDILNYSEEIDKTQEQIDVVKVLRNFETVTVIEQNTRKSVKRTVESDISFDSGQYHLLESGKQSLRAYCNEILAARQEMAQQFPDRRFLVRINIVGYTDQMDFKKGTNLLKLLTDGLDPQTLPQQEVDLRKFLNRRLSELRAQTIGAFLQDTLQQIEPGLLIEHHSLGVGEELPSDVTPLEALSDPRRRICKIYTYILLR